MGGLDTLTAVWGAVILSAAVVAPYALLRIWAKSENMITALMNAYLPWLATILVILGIFGVG